MQKILTSIFLLFGLFFNILSAQAHTLWLELAGNNKLHQLQEVKIYFGEFSHAAPTPTAKWFSDLASVKVTVIAPDGTSSEIVERLQDSLCYKLYFKPSQVGVYQVSFSHEVKDVFKDMKITYASLAFVNIENVKQPKLTTGLENSKLEWIDTRKYKQFNYIEFNSLVKNGILTTVKEGSGKENNNLSTNDKGQVIVPKDFKGRYLIELTDVKAVENGVHNGKIYKNDFKQFSFLLSI